MKTFVKSGLLLGVAVVFAGNARAAEADEAERPAETGFARYQTILDRMPFGDPPPNFDPTAPGNSAGGAAVGGAGAISEAEKSAEEQRLQAAVRVSMLNVKPDGRVFVGFTDSTAQPAKHHYLAVGEQADGWKVKSADPDAAVQEVVLEKDGFEVTLKLGSGMAGNKAGKSGAAPVAAARGARQEGVGARAFGRNALRGRRAKQEEAIAAAEAGRKAAEAKAEEERKQMAAERAQQAAEREEQRNALLSIQEELRRQRESREAAKAEQKAAEGEAE